MSERPVLAALRAGVLVDFLIPENTSLILCLIALYIFVSSPAVSGRHDLEVDDPIDIPNNLEPDLLTVFAQMLASPPTILTLTV